MRQIPQRTAGAVAVDDVHKLAFLHQVVHRQLRAVRRRQRGFVGLQALRHEQARLTKRKQEDAVISPATQTETQGAEGAED